jgi:hypothetical protein
MIITVLRVFRKLVWVLRFCVGTELYIAGQIGFYLDDLPKPAQKALFRSVSINHVQLNQLKPN